MRPTTSIIAFVLILPCAVPASAETPADFLARFEGQARQEAAGFAASSERGRTFFNSTQGGEWSCATCHTRDPAAPGRHATTGKRIEPMAPRANPERLSSARNVAKWFRRNCRDVLGRECSAAEKADVVAYLSNLPQR